MVFLNYTTMQVTSKIVYYGPGLCGKTTNLQWIHRRTAPGSRGDMVSLETEADRTLFFDLLPLDVGMVGGMKVRLQLYTVPGQVFYNTTRRLVLKGVDGVVFVADSQVPALDANEESLANLRQNLEELGLDPREVPLAFQYNKRDLGHILPLETLREALNPGGAPEFEAAAIHGVGVFETLKEISRQALDSVRARIAETTGRGVPRKKAAPRAPAPVTAPRPQPPVEDLLAQLGPLEIEFAEEDVEAGLRPVRTQGSDDIVRELSKLREVSGSARAPTSVISPGDVSELLQNLMPVESEREQEIDRTATVDVPARLLHGLTDLRIHLGLDRDGREEVLRDAVRVTLVRTKSLGRLRLRLDLDLKGR
jgi:signal recognition particle receptor subunit beta